MFDFLWNTFFFIVALGSLVTIHEAGHFFAAKLCKVKVLVFSIGFGYPIYKKLNKDGSYFQISAIPLGGYVQMLGEGKEDSSKEYSNEYLEKRSFKYKTKKQKAFIIAAGPLSNIILAIFLYTIVNMLGVNSIKPAIDTVEPYSISEHANIKHKDLILEVNESEVNDWSDVLTKILTSDDRIHLLVKENLGEGSLKNIFFSKDGIDIKPNTSLFKELGITPLYGKVSDTLDVVTKDGGAYKAGLKVGDKIIALNKESVSSWSDITTYLSKYKEKTISITYVRDNKEYEVKANVNYVFDNKLQKEVAKLGIGVYLKPIEKLQNFVQYNPFDAFIKGIEDTYKISTLVIKSLKMLIVGSISPENISGPISIAKGAGDSASYGLSVFLVFVAMISVNLGVFNLLPLPILDGGQLIYIAYEAITGKEPNARVQFVLTALGFCLLILLTIFAIFNDIRYLV